MNIIRSIKNINNIGNQLVDKPNKSDDEEISAKAFIKTRFLLITINLFLLIGSVAWIVYSLEELPKYEQMLQGAVDGSDITYMIDGRVQRTPLSEVEIINGEFEQHRSVNVYFDNDKVVEISQSGEQLLVGKRIFDILKAYVILVIFSFGVIFKTVGKPYYIFLTTFLKSISEVSAT